MTKSPNNNLMIILIRKVPYYKMTGQIKLWSDKMASIFLCYPMVGILNSSLTGFHTEFLLGGGGGDFVMSGTLGACPI